MSAVFGSFPEWDAQRALARLTDQIGAAGLAATAIWPAVSAAVDQHAAAVRDILVMGVEGAACTTGAVLLAGYAGGLLDQARTDTASVVAAVGGQWHRAGWLALRLVAVCALSRSEAWAGGHSPSGPSGLFDAPG